MLLLLLVVHTKFFETPVPEATKLCAQAKAPRASGNAENFSISNERTSNEGHGRRGRKVQPALLGALALAPKFGVLCSLEEEECIQSINQSIEGNLKWLCHILSSATNPGHFFFCVFALVHFWKLKIMFTINYGHEHSTAVLGPRSLPIFRFWLA